MEIVQGKHFSITDPQGVNTVIYKVNETEKEYLKESPKYTIERLDYSEEIRGEVKKKTFFVDEPKEEEDLVITKFTAKINERPRKKLNFSTPKECFYKDIS